MRFQSAKELVKLYGVSTNYLEGWGNITNDEKRARVSSIVTGRILAIASPISAEELAPVEFEPEEGDINFQPIDE